MVELVENAELLAFTKIVDARSLTRAAAELGIPRATVGKRLSRLEQRLGVRLIRRTTRSLTLTDAGEGFYRQARLVLEAVTNAQHSVQREPGELSGELRVSLPPMTSSRFLDTLAEFVEAHPAVRVQIAFSSRLVDLRREGYDVALRATEQLEPGLIARTIARTSLVAVAAPRYLAEHGSPRRPSDLSRHRCLMGFARGELPQTHWNKIPLVGAFFSNSPDLLVRLAARGQGIALVPEIVAAELIAKGKLVVVMPKVLRVEGRMALVYPDRELVPAQVRAFIDWMVARLPPLFARAREADRQTIRATRPLPASS